MPRKPKPDEFVRVPVSIAMMRKILDWLNERRGYRSLSEEVHRILADAYNAEHPEDRIKYWKEKNAK